MLKYCNMELIHLSDFFFKLLFLLLFTLLALRVTIVTLRMRLVTDHRIVKQGSHSNHGDLPHYPVFYLDLVQNQIRLKKKCILVMFNELLVQRLRVLCFNITPSNLFSWILVI